MLQFFGALLDVVLGASISDHHQHLGDVPPHAAVRGEHLLIHMLQSHSCQGRTREGRLSGLDPGLRSTLVNVWVGLTCLRVASSVADSLQRRQHDAFVVVRVELELGLGVVTVLHQ